MFWTVTLSILQGCSQAVKLFFLTLLFALPLGLVVAFGSMSKWAPFRALAYRQQEARGFARWLSQLRPLSALTNVIVWIIRGTPLILQLIIIFYGPGTWFGTNPWNAFRDGRMTACCIAFIRALKMSVASISAASTRATAQQTAFWVITWYRASRFFSVSFLLSLRPSIRQQRGKITAAAYTGPAKGPAPASSQPQIVPIPCSVSSRSICHRSVFSVIYFTSSTVSSVKRPNLPPRNSSSKTRLIRSVSTSAPRMRKPRLRPARTSRS